MDKVEAASIANAELQRLRALGYEALAQRIGESETHQVRGDSGVVYQAETMVIWDGQAGGDLRVIASVDDGRWRAFQPLSRDFIMRPDGSEIE